MKKNHKVITIFTIGFALFSMFFGAGNLILPPFIGLMSGEEWSLALLGFFITAILAPFLGILMVTVSGTSFTDLGNRFSPLLINILTFFIIICIGPLIAIPRTGATTYEVGFSPFFPSLSPSVFSMLFFSVVMGLSISKTKIVNIIGQVLTPFLLLSLIVLVLMGIFNPLQSPTDVQVPVGEVFSMSLVEGYQTLDVLASVIFAGIIISAVMDNGYTSSKDRVQITIFSGLISTISLLFIYGGLIYLGATTDYPYNGEVSRTELLLYISKSILGNSGAFVISIAISLACLTTAIALTSATGEFFEKITQGKLSYKMGVVLCTLISGVLSVNSVDEIISYAVHILLFIYPITFILILMVLIFGKIVKEKTPYILGIIVASIFSLLDILEKTPLRVPFLLEIKKAIPLSEYGLAWLLPSIFVFIISALFIRRIRK